MGCRARRDVDFHDTDSSLLFPRGEVALPGGKRDDADADDVATALREAEEEASAPEAPVNAYGKRSPYNSQPVDNPWSSPAAYLSFFLRPLPNA